MLPPRVWTSIDGGGSWQRARVRPADRSAIFGGRFDVTLPEVEEGTDVSLRVDARDVRGNRIKQTLYDAYTG